MPATLRQDEQGQILWADFPVYCHVTQRAKDIDPIYNVLRALHTNLRYDVETQIQHIFHTLMWYNLGSSHSVWLENGEGMREPTYQQAKKSTGLARRGFRDGWSMIDHFKDMMAKTVGTYGSFHKWATTGLTNNPAVNWKVIFDRSQLIYGNGRYMAYKICEMLQKVCWLPLVPTDMGHRGSSAPRQALPYFYEGLPAHEDQSDNAISLLDAVSQQLHDRLLGLGVDLADIGETETLLCGFHSCCEGRDYVGHDTDMMQETIEKSASAEAKAQLYKARFDSLPHPYLGELNGWCGVDKSRNTAYRDHRQILIRADV